MPDLLPTVAMTDSRPPGNICRGFPVVLTLLFLPGLGAQEILYRFDGARPGETAGAVVSRLGDLDGDGIPEIGVSAPLASDTTQPGGPVRVYSGATGAQLLRLDPIKPRALCFALTGIGDIDRDGVPDILVGAPFTAPPIQSPLGLLYGAGSVQVFSGSTGAVLFSFHGEQQGAQLGHSVDALADLNGDGVAEMLLGAPFTGPGELVGAGSAVVRSGADGEILFAFHGSRDGDYLGWSVAGLPDINGDGAPELMLAALYGGQGRAGRVFVRSGASGEQLFELDGSDASELFGMTLAAAGDIDGDGVADIVVGAPGASLEGRVQAGSVFVFSGATRMLAYRLDGPEPFGGFGESLAGGQDVDGDGVPDIVVGAPSASPGGRPDAGSAFVYSGATGSLLFRMDGSEQGESLGRSVALAGDLNGDRRSEIIVGVPYADPGGMDGAGSALVLSYR